MFKYQTVRDAIYALILKNLTTDEGTRAYIKMEMDESDTFHTDLIHDVVSNGTRNTHGEMEELLDQSYYDVRELIIDHFANSMNFAPGYTKPDFEIKEEVSDEELNQIIESLKS